MKDDHDLMVVVGLMTLAFAGIFLIFSGCARPVVQDRCHENLKIAYSRLGIEREERSAIERNLLERLSSCLSEKEELEILSDNLK